LADRIAIIERGIDGMSVYLIRISYFEHNKDFDLCNKEEEEEENFMSYRLS
jgi:hypothetical protein